MGAGSQHANTEHYARGAYLAGGKSYRLHLPPNIPAKVRRFREPSPSTLI